MNPEFTFASQYYAQEFVKRLMSKRGQLFIFLMLVEKRTLSMLLSTRLPMLSQTRQNIVEIPAVQNCLKSSLWSGSTSNSQVVTCGVEFHANSNSSCVSAYFPARCTARPVACVCHTRVSARLSTAALSQLKTFAHPISHQTHISLKNLTRTVFLPLLLMCSTLQTTSPAILKERFFQQACRQRDVVSTFVP